MTIDILHYISHIREHVNLIRSEEIENDGTFVSIRVTEWARLHGMLEHLQQMIEEEVLTSTKPTSKTGALD